MLSSLRLFVSLCFIGLLLDMKGRASVYEWVRQLDSEALYRRVERYDNNKCMSCDRRTPCSCKIAEKELQKRWKNKDDE